MTVYALPIYIFILLYRFFFARFHIKYHTKNKSTIQIFEFIKLMCSFIIHIQEENNISILSTPHIPYDKVLNL
jgi:purine-cytosine permease-like protein